MKIQTECVPCLLKRIVFEAEQSTKSKELREKTLKKACTLLAELYNPTKCSVSIATKVHKIAYETLGDKDPYKELKTQSNITAKKLVPRVEELIQISEEPLRMSMLCSIIGKLFDIFEDSVSQDFGHDDYDKLKTILEKSKNVILFTDNCGEIVFDKILCRELKKFNPDIFLTVVVKGEPVLSDATMQDAQELGFQKVTDEILTTGCFAVGVDFEKMPKVVSDRLESSDLIICKGMGNYEAFSEKDYKPLVYLLRTKCSTIANSMGLKQNINVIKLYD